MVDSPNPELPAPLDRERDLGLIGEVEADLTAVEAALARLDDGTYGRCRHCGADIADERLAAHPATTDCGAHPAADDGSPT